MSTFTDEYFKKNSITKTSSSKKTSTSTTTSSNKTTKKIDNNNFTKSYFENYDIKGSKKNTKSNTTEENEKVTSSYETFLKRLEQEKVLEEQRKAERIARQQDEKAIKYYENEKENLKKKRTNDLVYNWNLQDSGGVNYDYGKVPKQNEKGYLKKVDSKGNEYWLDSTTNTLYNSKGEVIANNKTNKNFINTLKYEYDENSKSNINAKALNNKDKIGLTKIDPSKYQFLIDNENDRISKIKEETIKRNEVLNKNNYLYNDKNPLVNKHVKEGWVIKDGKYYKPTDNEENSVKINNKNYIEVKDEKPVSYINQKQFDIMMNTVPTNIYEKEFKKLNKAIEEGKYTTANNALQIINTKYFGHSYDDGWWAAIFDSNADDRGFFEKRFNDNIEKLDVINNSISNTKDADLLEELEKEKNKLELENTLIQYNKLYFIQSNNSLVDRIDSIMEPVDEAWSKTGKMWKKTFREFEDGYQFGDLLKTGKHTLHNTFQTIGATGKMTTSSINAMNNLAVSDMDDGTFKDVWMPGILQAVEYTLVPEMILINYAEPGAVVEAGVLREGSATIDSEDGEPRVPDAKNILGATLNIGFNYLSDLIFAKNRKSFTDAAYKELLEKSGKDTAKYIFKDTLEAGVGEAIEEFGQTYAEYMQNMDGDLSWSFLLEHLKEASQSALVAGVTSSGVRATGHTYAQIRGTNVEVPQNYKINRDIKENSNTTLYTSNNTKTFEDISYESTKQNDVTLNEDTDAITDIAEQLEENNIITILDTEAIKTDKNSNVNLDNDIGTTVLSDAVINDNIKTVLVPSKEIETYLKSLRNDLVTYVIDPKSNTFMDDIKDFIDNVSKSNIVTKNVSDFTVNDYKFSPTEMNDINNMVNEYINKGNLLDSINKVEDIKLNPITTSDITDSDINTIMNSIRSKFLEEIDNNRISKETAQKEFKQLSNKLSEYAIKTKKDRTYISDDKNNIITFAKRGSNLYEATTTIPARSADLEVFANVKTNGNIINGNLNQRISFAKKQLNSVNTLIDKLKLKGNYLTEDSTYKDVASLIKQNQDFSKEILQSLNADGLIEGKNKVRLYTAFDNLDNANPIEAIKNTTKDIEKTMESKEIVKETNTIAPKTIESQSKETTISVNDKPLDVNKYAYNPEDTTELNNIEMEKMLDDAFKDLKITNKKMKIETDKLKTLARKYLFDRYVNIRNIAKANDDVNVKYALAELQSVASDSQLMINKAQMHNGEVIGKSLKQIFKDGNFTKNQKTDFERYMLLRLNVERENAGVEKVLPDLSKEKSKLMADKLLSKNPKFGEVAKDLKRYNDNLLDMLVDGGVITGQLSNKLKNRYQYYMPIYSSDLTTFSKLDDNKYLKSMSLDDTIKDVTKPGKHVQKLEKSLETKTYNVLSAISKNKLINEMYMSGNYESDNNAEILFYQNGKMNKLRTSKDIISDINKPSFDQFMDKLVQYPVIKQLAWASNQSYKFILDPVYQFKNLVIDFTDSQLVYSKEKKSFAKNWTRAAIAAGNNSELFNEMIKLGIAEPGKMKISYDENGNVKVKQNKYQRIRANLEAMPKMAEYISLKEKYMAQARKDYEAGKYNIDNNLKSKRGQDFNAFNETIVKGHNGKPLYISRYTSSPDEIEYINTYKQDGIENYGWWYANSPTDDKYYNSKESNKFINDLFDKSTANMIKDKKGVFATISEEYLTPPSQDKITAEGRYNYIEGHLTGKIFDISEYGNELPFDVSTESEIDTEEKFEKLEQKRRDKVTEIYTNLKNKYDKNNKYSLDDFRKYIPLIDALKLDGYSGIVSDYNDGTKEIVIFDESKFMPLKEYNELNSKNNTPQNISFKDIQEEIKLKAKTEAQDVNLNFNEGGIIPKALSKGGFKFLNAGMLGMDKFVTHVGDKVKTPKGAGSLLLEFTAIGAVTSVANNILNADDEDYDKLPYYYKNNYYMIKVGDNKFIRIPKGRVQTLYNVIFEYSTGIREEDTAKDYFDSVKSAFELAVLPPSLEGASPIAAWKQLLENKDAFGNEIYSEKYDDAETRAKKQVYHLLGNYFGRYGRMVKDITDDDSTTDIINEFDYYKDTTKANRHYSTFLSLVDYYSNKDHVKTDDDRLMKKYIDTQNYALRSINSEINQGKKSGKSAEDMSYLYAARDNLLKSAITNYKNFDKEVDENGNITYYFDEHSFTYNKSKNKVTKNY